MFFLNKQECQCIVPMAATVKLWQKLDNQPFKSCFQILKAWLILVLMSSFPSWKNDRKLMQKLQIFLRASGRCLEPRLLPSARPRELFWELDPTCRGSSAPTTPPLDGILYAFLAHGAKFFLLTDDYCQHDKNVCNLPSGIVHCPYSTPDGLRKWNEFFHLLSKKCINLAERHFADFL